MALLKNKTPIKELLKNQNVQRMLKTIRYAEGTDNERGYNTRVGYQYFNDLSKKPGKSVYIKSIGQSSSAEGAYQFLNGTWDNVSKSLGLKDFSKESQDLAAIELIRRRGALEDVLNNDFETAVNKLSPEWASLPKSDGKGYYGGQKARSMSKLRKVYDGKITPEITNYKETEKSSTFVPIPEASVNESKLYSVDITKADKEKTEITEQEQQVEAELDNAKREEDFLNEYFSQQEAVQFEQPAQQMQESPAPNTMQDFTQIEQFVDNPLLKQGGEVNSLWKNIRNARGSGKEPTKEMLEQERKIKAQKQEGGVIKDNMGQWKYPGSVTEIASPNITMKGVSEPLVGISKQTGERKIMLPGLEYFFNNTKNVLEIPLIKMTNTKNNG